MYYGQRRNLNLNIKITIMRKNLLFIMLTFIWAAFGTEAFAQQTLIDENFDQFTEGTEDNPATTDISGYTGKLNQTIGWNGKYVYEAGGKLLVKDGGNLITARLTELASTSNIKITFDAKSPADYGGLLTINFNYAYSGDQTVIMNDNQWHTFSVILEKATSTKNIKFTPFLAAEGIMIDNVKIEAGNFIAAPEAYQPSKATKTEFTASWKSVNGATAYLLDVYTKDGDNKSYLLQDDEVTGTSKVVSGLDETKTYYYDVRATNGEMVSDRSNEIEVVEVFSFVLPPKALPATDITSSGFTANWEAAENASRYTVILSRTETMTEEKEVNIIEDDFSKVKEGSFGEPEYKISTVLDDFTAQPGWTADGNTCLAVGHMGIAPFGNDGYVMTPALDLSHNNGTFTVKVNMAEMYIGQPSSGTDVEFRLYNGETLAETKSVTLEEGFKDYTADFTAGTAESYIQIYYKNTAENSSNKLFIDKFAVSQTLSAGESYSTRIEEREVGNVTSEKFSVELSETVSYTYQVVAHARTVTGGELDWITSGESDAIEVTYQEEVKNVTIDPEEGVVGSLQNFVLTFSDYQFVDIAADSYAGAAKLINNDTKEEITATVEPGVNLNKVKVVLPEEVTAAGSYTLHIPSGKLYDGIDPDETDLPEYNFSYTIDGSVTPPVVEPENVTADPADGSEVSSLKTITVTFDYDGSVYTGNKEIQVVNDETEEVVTTADVNLNTGYVNQVNVVLKDEIKTNGKYTVKFPAGAFVKGDLAQAEETNPFELHYTVKIPTGINGAENDSDTTVMYRVNANGQRINAPQKGINIIKMSDGTTRKVVLK